MCCAGQDVDSGEQTCFDTYNIPNIGAPLVNFCGFGLTPSKVPVPGSCAGTAWYV